MTAEKLPPLIETRPGIYRHSKGLLYEVLGTVRHSETLEPMTLYRALYGEHGLWVRPAAMFSEEVMSEGVKQPRFAWVSEARRTPSPEQAAIPATVSAATRQSPAGR